MKTCILTREHRVRRCQHQHARRTDADAHHVIIPVYMENTVSGHPLALLLKSSPHARGTHLHEVPHDRQPGIIPACAGNTQRRRADQDRVHGIIPACAGNTIRSTGTPTATRDHPRMRGEHRTESRRAISRPGSSPHARGTRPRRPCRTRPKGIIPACAGNTGWC